jgi:predicted ester cyclase
MDNLAGHKRLYIRLADEVLTAKKLDVVDELIAENFVEHVGGSPKTVGVEGFKTARRRRNAAFPDWRVEIHDLIAEGDKIVVRATGHGTHQGEFLGIAPTGRRVVVSWIAIYRVANGKLAEHWQNIDDLGLLRQLGASVALPGDSTFE